MKQWNVKVGFVGGEKKILMLKTTLSKRKQRKWQD